MARGQPGRAWRWPLETPDDENALACLHASQPVDRAARASDRLHMTTVVDAYVGVHR